MKTEITFQKFDAAKQIVYGTVYAPLTADSQGDWATAETIEKMAHDFSAKNRAGAIDVEHNQKPSGAVVVESFVARKGDQDFLEGAWAMGIKTPDNIWQLVKSGKITGLSMYGRGERLRKSLPGQPAGKNELINGEILSVSLVGRAANKETFTMTKSDDSIAALAAQFKTIAEQIAETTETIKTQFAAQQAQIDSLTQGADGRVVKAAPVVNRNQERIDYQLRKMDRFQSRLESIWERPDLADATSESDLRRRIAKCSDELYALGYQSPRADLETNSAFLFRGGTSQFLQGGISNLDDILGVSRNTRALEKSADEIDLCSIYI